MTSHRTPHLSSRWLAYVLVLLVLTIFGQVWQFSFLNLDDNVYVTENDRVRGGLTWESLVWAFQGFHDANWIPLVWLSLMADAELFGDYAGGFHLTNVAIHAVNVVLVFLLLVRLTEDRGKSFVVAALFAAHPLHVESVAWVSERKDLLSTLFGLLSLLAYVRYAQRRSQTDYVLAWTAMAASLMAKQMLVTLPCVFLLLDYWPLGRFPKGVVASATRHWTENAEHAGYPATSVSRLLLEKVSFLVLGVLFAVVAYLAQSSGGATAALEPLALNTRLANAVAAYGRYLAKTVWPTGLSVFYPHRGSMPGLTELLGAACVLLLLTAVAVHQRKSRPFLLVGWLWFLGTLVPVIGIIQIGWQQIADRYTYFPLIGLFVPATWLVPSLVPSRSVNEKLMPVAVAVVLGTLSVVSFRQVGHWRDSVSLFEHAVEVTEDNWLAHATLGAALISDPDRWDDGERHLRESIRIRSTFATAHFNLGLLLSDRGRLQEANSEFYKSLELKPPCPEAHYFLALNARRLGDMETYQKHSQQAKDWLEPETRPFDKAAECD